MESTTGVRGETLTWTFFLDVDNTLIDNDAVKGDLDQTLGSAFGEQVAAEFWAVYEQVRQERDRVDFPEVLRRFCAGAAPRQVAERLEQIVDGIPFARYRYPGALEAIAHLSRLGTTVILSDGDPVYQRTNKIEKAGLGQAVGERVLITTHKERELSEAMARYPAQRYVMIDDKPGVLARIKAREPVRFRTILIAQGKYAHDPRQQGGPLPDLTIAHIGELAGLRLEQLAGPGG